MDLTGPRPPETLPAQQSADAQPGVQSRQIVAYLLAVLCMLIVGFLGYKALRIGLHGWSAYRNGVQLAEAVRSDPSPERLALVQPQLERLARATAGLEAEMRTFAPLLDALGRSVHADTLAAVPELLIVGAEMSGLAAEGLRLATPALSVPPAERLEALLAAIASHPTVVADMAARAERANAALQLVPADRIHPALAERIAQAQSVSPLLAPGLRAAPSLPAILGMNGPVTYLILFQNNHELRGTGGFISAVGELTVEQAKIAELDISDSYDFYNPALAYPVAPQPMQAYMPPWTISISSHSAHVIASVPQESQ